MLSHMRKSPAQFQCPLSGLVGCNVAAKGGVAAEKEFQCPLSGLVGCNNGSRPCGAGRAGVSMPFKRAGWLQQVPPGLDRLLRRRFNAL